MPACIHSLDLDWFSRRALGWGRCQPGHAVAVQTQFSPGAGRWEGDCSYPSICFAAEQPHRGGLPTSTGLCSQGALLDMHYLVIRNIPLPTASLWPITRS